MTRVAITVDFEPDCPPYLSSTFRGITEGAPRLLALLAECDVRATFFTTGEVAARYPGAVRTIVDAGHELACHGVTHTAFDTLDESRAAWEIETSAVALRAFAPVHAFRAPYLRFPERFVPLLEAAGFTADASLAKYKTSYFRARPPTRLARVATSTTSSVLRLPSAIRNPVLRALADPVVLFVHPWEFVDLTGESLRWDCRFRTGDPALRCLRDVIALFAARGDRFVTVGELAAAERAPNRTTARRA